MAFDINFSQQSALDFTDAVSLGRIKNIAGDRKFGHNNVGTTFTVVSAGGILWLPTVASVVRIKAGGNAADDQADAVGANAIIVEGLDGDGNQVTETLLPHATSGILVGVTGTQLFLRVNRAYVSAAGTAEGNVGDITVEVGAGGTDVIQIPATMGQSESSHISVPAGWTMLADDAFFYAEGGKLATIRVIRRKSDGIRRSQQRLVGATGQAGFGLHHSTPTSGIADFWVEGFIPATGGEISSSMAFHFFKNSA